MSPSPAVIIRGCREDDVPELMAFLADHWRRDHVLARSRSLLDWQHRQPDGDFAYRVAHDGNGIAGVIGYIQASRYDPGLTDHDTLWIALWVVRADLRGTALGLRLLDDVRTAVPHVSVAVNGINPDHPPMYRALGFTAVSLVQHFAVNASVPRNLVAGPAGHRLPLLQPGSALSIELDGGTIDDANITPSDGPPKSPEYFRRRFLDHPFYAYRVHALSWQGSTALLASRLADHGGRRALRLVDFAGPAEVLAESGSVLSELLNESEAEFVDLIEHGLPSAAVARTGLEPVDPDGPIIVPNYFEPLVLANSRPLCAYRTSLPVFRVFRADGDQDRPNVLPGDDDD